MFTDWRGDRDERLDAKAPRSVPSESSALVGVLVRGLVWRSYLDTLQFSKEENRHFGRVFYPLHSGPTQTSAT